MTKINIYFQDLNEDKQEELKELIRQEIIEDNKEEIEKGEINENDIEEMVDNYINCNNFKNEYEI